MQSITGAIPSPPLLAFKVLKVARQEPLDFGALTRIVATDASLSSNLLKHANSSRHGVRRPITDLSRALVTLGRDMVVNIVMLDAMRSMKAAVRVSWPTGDDRFWKHAVGVAVTARFLATRTGLPFPEEAFTCGLFHDFGKLVMLYHSRDAYTQILEEATRKGAPLYAIENKLLGRNHATIGGLVCRQWRLPESIVHAVEAHHEKPDVVYGTLGNFVRSANLLVKIAGIGHSGSPHAHAEELRRLPHARLSLADLNEAIVQLPAQVNELAAYVLGPSKGEEEPADTPASRDDAAKVGVAIADDDERELVRYLLLSLGYTPVTAKDGVETVAKAGVVVTDTLDDSSGTARIDYRAWRALPENDADGDLNCASLRTWLTEQLHHARTVAHDIAP